MGRPPILINWDEFDKLVSYQCTQIEVAHFFGVSVDLLEDACRRDRGESLAEVWNKKRAFGRVRLRKAQFNIVEKCGPGAATMAIYLDKKMFPDERVYDTPPPFQPPPGVTTHQDDVIPFEEFCKRADYHIPFEKQKEMRAFIFDETETRLLLGARGYGKTDYCTIMGVAYEQYVAWKKKLNLSDFTNLIITKSKTRNAAILAEIETALEKNGVPLEKANGSLIRVAGLRGKDHSIEAITIKSSMRGRHPKRIIMDDPVTDEDVSEATRVLVKRRYDEAYKLCSNIAIIGQPAHFDDLYAKLRGVVKTMEVPHGQIPALDADLEAMKLACVDPTTIEMSYHLRVPRDGAAIFSGLKYVDKFPVGDSAVLMIDPSDGGDLTAYSVIKGHFDGVAVEGYAWKRPWYHCSEELVAICKKLNVKRVCFETNHAGTEPIRQLRQLLEPLGIGVCAKFSTTEKHASIQAAGSYSHMIHLSKESMPIYTDRVTKYEYGSKNDDPPDSLARGLEWLGLIRGK